MLIDIACNIIDKQFKKQNIADVIERCKEHKTMPIFVGVDYESSVESLLLAEKYNTLTYCGIHPTHSKSSYDINKIADLKNKHVAGIGECGLDYYRLEYSNKEIQKRVFRDQLNINGSRYFLHCRNSHRDFMEILSDYKIQGVVHSFTGTIEEAKEVLKKGFFIGINGCSLKTSEGIDLVKELPIERILIETDSPYCRIRKSYSVYKYLESKFLNVKKINEPCCVKQVAESISNIKNILYSDLEKQLEENCVSFYGAQFNLLKGYWNT